MSSIQALVENLEKLNDIHCSLLDICEKKRPIIVQNKVEELNQLVNKENKLLRQVMELDQERKELVNQYLYGRGYNPNPKITISDLTKLMFKPEEKKLLQDTQAELLRNISKIQEVNELNQKLIEQSLMYIDYSLDLFIGPTEEDVVYIHPQQNTYSPKRPGIFDAKA